MLVFFSQLFGVFLGWLIVVDLGLEGLGVFVFLVFVFIFCVAFVSVLFALFLALWLDVVVLFFFGVCFFGCFFCCFVFWFCFFGGFKGQVRWPKGPPHLALNPPYFICFCFVCLFVFCVFLFYLFLFFCCYFFCFFLLFWVSLSLLLLEKTVFPPKKGIFVYFFSESPFVSL